MLASVPFAVIVYFVRHFEKEFGIHDLRHGRCRQRRLQQLGSTTTTRDAAVLSCCCCCTRLLLHRSWLFRANWEVAKPIFPHKDPASNITNRQNSISSISSYNFTIPATTKEITQTCWTLPILIIFVVYILPLPLSVSLSLCLSHPCPCLRILVLVCFPALGHAKM